MSPNVERLTFAWWNTALSPPVPSFKKRTDQDYEEAARIVRLLLRDFHVDFLAFGEVTDQDLCTLRNAVGGKSYAIFDGTYRDGRLIGDTGAIYNEGSLIKIHQIKVVIEHGDIRLKVANRVDFLTQDKEHLLHVFISHWPSPLQPENASLRDTLAHHLRGKIDELMPREEKDNDVPPVILMGDYNEEPFHRCMESTLLATRDRSLIKRHHKHLYNPFWRLLGESVPYSPSTEENGFAGTCVVKGGRLTKWKTVDQVIVSSAFLGGSPWHLNEELTMILDLRNEAPYGYSSKGFFDHLPVIAVIDKVQSDGGQTND
jgi:hypothetical protein